MNNLQKYSAYKHSGVDWLGEIPEHWDVMKIKYLFKEINERSLVGEEELLSVSQYTGVTLKSDKVEEGDLLTNASTLEGYKRVKNGDLVSNIMLAWNGSLGFSPYDGITSPAYSIYRLNEYNVNGYFHYLLRTEIFKAEFKRNSSGVIESRLRLYTDDFFSIASILPPQSEQAAIATFLDQKTIKIDQAIAIKEKQIELLKERKQIIIQQVVTGKIVWNKDKNAWTEPAKVKDSGVEWIGKVPEDWDVHRNFVLFQERNEPGNESLPLLSVSIHTAVSSEELDEDDNIRGKVKIQDKSNYKLVKINDIAFNMMRAWQGGIGAVNTKGMVSPAYIVAKSKVPLNARYFEYLFRTTGFIQQIDRSSKGITDFRKRLYWNEFKQLQTLIPSLNEQDAIVKHIENQSSKIDKAISLQEQQIEKLKEYRTVLVDAAVTGKIKVC